MRDGLSMLLFVAFCAGLYFVVPRSHLKECGALKGPVETLFVPCGK